MEEPPLGAARAELVRPGEELDQPRPVALLDHVEEGLDREHVVEVHQQLVVAVDEGDEAGDAALLAASPARRRSARRRRLAFDRAP